MDESTTTSQQAGRISRVSKGVLEMPVNPLLNCDRLTITAQVSFEQCGFQPKSVPLQFAQPLETRGEEAYQRRIRVDEGDWQKLDMGWCQDNPGYIILESLVGQNLPVLPTEEQKAFFKTQILYIKPNFLVRPGRFFIGEFAYTEELLIRSAAGTIPVNVTVIPR
jgi:hypothetical protein